MLSTEERELCDAFDNRLWIVRDRTKGCAYGYSTGFYLWGEGGISKSWTVLDELDKCNAAYKVTNSRLTGAGLFELLKEHPDHVHVLEDMESLAQSPNAAGVLRSALWTTKPVSEQQHQERLVTWGTKSLRDEFIFTGSIIFTMNLALEDCPALRAVRTRIVHLHLQPTNAEVRAKMKQIAMRGFQHGEGVLTPAKCLEVWEVIIEKCDEAGRNYDMRMLVGGFKDRLQADAGDSTHDWKDLIESRMKERVILPSGRTTQKIEEQRIAMEINSQKLSRDQKVLLWKQRTGKAKNAFYHRLKELNGSVR